MSTFHVVHEGDPIAPSSDLLFENRQLKYELAQARKLARNLEAALSLLAQSRMTVRLEVRTPCPGWREEVGRACAHHLSVQAGDRIELLEENARLRTILMRLGILLEAR